MAIIKQMMTDGKICLKLIQDKDVIIVDFSKQARTLIVKDFVTIMNEEEILHMLIICVRRGLRHTNLVSQ